MNSLNQHTGRRLNPVSIAQATRLRLLWVAVEIPWQEDRSSAWRFSPKIVPITGNAKERLRYGRISRRMKEVLLHSSSDCKVRQRLPLTPLVASAVLEFYQYVPLCLPC